jgi:superfamily I DNA/RNA helicase
VILQFFEGPAGSGKTHRLIEAAREEVNAGRLTSGQRILALTFMNGARRRLEASLGKHAELRRRFDCRTVDAFAQTIVGRRKSQLAECGVELKVAGTLKRFDSTCYLAARMLRRAEVARWVAMSYPLILVDEAQDLDAYRCHSYSAFRRSAQFWQLQMSFSVYRTGWIQAL